MKKLLAIFGAIGLTATTASAVVACKDPASKTEKKSIDDIDLGTVKAQISETATGKINEADAKRIKDTIFTVLKNKMSLSDKLKNITIKESDYSIVNGDIIKAEATITDIESASYQIKASDSSTVIKGTSKAFKIKLEQKKDPSVPAEIEFDLGNKTINSNIEFHYDSTNSQLTKEQHSEAVYTKVLDLTKKPILDLIKAQYPDNQDLITAKNLKKGDVYINGANDTKELAEKKDFEKKGTELYAQFIGINQLKGYFYVKITVNLKTRLLDKTLDTVTIESSPKALEALLVTGEVLQTKANAENIVKQKLADIAKTIIANTTLFTGPAENIKAENLLVSGVKSTDKKTDFAVGDLVNEKEIYVTITGAAGKPVEGTIFVKVTLKNVLSA